MTSSAFILILLYRKTRKKANGRDGVYRQNDDWKKYCIVMKKSLKTGFYECLSTANQHMNTEMLSSIAQRELCVDNLINFEFIGLI